MNLVLVAIVVLIFSAPLVRFRFHDTSQAVPNLKFSFKVNALDKKLDMTATPIFFRYNSRRNAGDTFFFL